MPTSLAFGVGLLGAGSSPVASFFAGSLAVLGLGLLERGISEGLFRPLSEAVFCAEDAAPALYK